MTDGLGDTDPADIGPLVTPWVLDMVGVEDMVLGLD